MVKDVDQLEKVKEDYKVLSKKFSLPSWKDLDEGFDISKVLAEGSEFVLRDIRRKINEKLSAYLHLFETFLNPHSAPMFVLNVLKNLEEKDMEGVKKVYKEISKMQFEQMIADTIYSEEKEADLIKKSFELWEKEKKNIVEIIKILDRKYSETSLDKKKSYYG